MPLTTLYTRIVGAIVIGTIGGYLQGYVTKKWNESNVPQRRRLNK